MNQSLLAAMAFALLLSAVPAKATDGTLDHLTPPQLLTVEHAEILLPDDSGDVAEGYLTIWNGTQMQVALASVQSELFARVAIVRTEFNSGDTNELPSGSVLPIPGHAELSMRSNGIRLRMEEPVWTLGDQATGDQAKSGLTLVFESGDELIVEAEVIRSRDLLTRHRHAEGDINPG